MTPAIRKTALTLVSGFILLLLVIPRPGTAETKEPCLPPEGATIKLSETSFMRLNYQMQLYAEWRDTGSGVDGTKPTTDFSFRRSRLSITGQASGVVGYSVKIEQAGPRRIGPVDVAGEPASDFGVLESYVTADLDESFRLVLGRSKIPFTREVLEGCFSALTLDRSLFISTPMARTRDMGIVAWGSLAHDKLQYFAAMQEGRETANAPESSPRYTGRVHLALLDPEDAFGYGGTYLGNKMVFTVGAGAQYEPGAVYSDVTNKTGEKNYSAWTADVFMEYPVGVSGSATLSGAYLKTSFDKAYQGSDPDPESIGVEGDKKGWYAKAGYLVIDKIGPGQIQPFLRYEQWDFASLNGVYAQQITWTAGGLNYLIKGQNLKLTLQYAATDFKDEQNAASRDFKTITAMLQAGF
ncbi:MAG: hypothetical protein A2X58_06875 [Nitrospirae bacterium GWC2_56_14]|nr:MAG: hypothetical protein A2X58_06875 [Nitrospirae bacterium GWC2_56_14]